VKFILRTIMEELCKEDDGRVFVFHYHFVFERLWKFGWAEKIIVTFDYGFKRCWRRWWIREGGFDASFQFYSIFLVVLVPQYHCFYTSLLFWSLPMWMWFSSENYNVIVALVNQWNISSRTNGFIFKDNIRTLID
jgi:hypothetical protein